MASSYDLRAFSLSSERILMQAKTTPLTRDETTLIEYYCLQLLSVTALRPPKDTQRTP
jgi:hypothetical protein